MRPSLPTASVRLIPNREKRPSGGTIRSLQRGLEVLDMIADRGRMSLTAIATQAGLNLSTTHHIIKSLRDLGYVTQTAEREYRLGVSVYKLAGAAWKGDDLGKIATPWLADLALRTKETAHLSVFDRGAAFIVLSRFETTTPWQMIERVSPLLPCHCTAMGKVLLAHQPDIIQAHHLTKSLKKFTARTVATADALKVELRAIRGQGFAISREEFTPGSISVAAPIRNYSGAVIASLGVHASTSTMTKDKVPPAIAATQEIAARLSRELGYDITQSARDMSASLSTGRQKGKQTVGDSLKAKALPKARQARSGKELTAR